MADYFLDLKEMMQEIGLFCRHAGGRRLRRYQVEAGHAILRSVIEKLGDTIVVMFPRQSGKNETQAQVEAYLLALMAGFEIEMVKVSPTYKPQTENAMRRLERALRQNFVCDSLGYRKEAGYIYRVGKARLYFLLGAPGASVVGATATHLLECDEEQDVNAEKWDREFAPMAASQNATRVFWGTAWTSQTLLARELRAARQREKDSGRRLVFTLMADEVRREVSAYGDYVDEQVRRLGRNHPLVRTQYYSEEIDGQGGMFPPGRRALMLGAHPALEAPRPGGVYCLLLDVAGEDENGEQPTAGRQLPLIGFGSVTASLHNPGRDSSALTVVEVDLGSLADELLRAPTYRMVNRYEWVGARHLDLYGQDQGAGGALGGALPGGRRHRRGGGAGVVFGKDSAGQGHPVRVQPEIQERSWVALFGAGGDGQV
jgi:hypothetical protein